jgi:leucine dehydrogenase
MLSVFGAPDFDDHELVVFGRDPDVGLNAIVAVHDTTLGPALGGCRMWPYASEEEALTDVLRLSRAMTYKHALAGTGQGGGKVVVIGDARTDKTPALMRALGRFVDTLGGRYITAEDVGTSVADMAEVREATQHVAGHGEGADPSPATAYGVFRGIKAAARHKFGADGLGGLRVAVQGLGHVGETLCRHLHEAGARLFVADTDEAASRRSAEAFGAVPVPPDDIHGLDVDVFAPCALGGVLNDATIPEIKAPIVAGAANNQLAERRHGQALAERGTLYAPDFVINAGGVIKISLAGSGNGDRVMRRTGKIYDTLIEIFRRADDEGRPTDVVAEGVARERIAAAREKAD